jgi:hypothetical protein
MSVVRDWPATGPDDPLHRRKHRADLERARAICLALTDTAEKITRGHLPVITAAGKNFAIFWRADARPNVCFAAPLGVQEALVDADPERYFVPAYMGVRGWVGARLDGAIDWDAIERLARDGHATASGDRPPRRAKPNAARTTRKKKR